MDIIDKIADGVGDLIGTSGLAKANRNAFKPILGVEITRNEYNISFKNPEFSDEKLLLSQAAKNMKIEEQLLLAKTVLKNMTDRGVNFSEKRLITFVNCLQLFPGNNPISEITSHHMSKEKSAELKHQMVEERKKYFKQTIGPYSPN